MVYIIETKGISIKCSKEDIKKEKIIFIIDTVGFETPLLKEETKKINKEE